MLQIFYTGNLITPNGSDVSVYGDPCEAGHGEDMVSGWVDPDWSLGEVRESREDVRPDVWTPEDGPMIDWVVDRLRERINVIDVGSAGERGTFYAQEATGPYDSCYTGVELMMAAHVDGASPEMLRAVCLALSVKV